MRNPLKQYGLFGWNYAHLFTHPWKIVGESYYRVKWFIQRGYRGYADCDVWSLDYYLSGWMPEALARLQANKIGHPIGMTQKGWDTRLEKMKQGFIEARKVSDMVYMTPQDCTRAQRRMEAGLKVFAKHFLSLWD